jgi:hypothetical protein
MVERAMKRAGIAPMAAAAVARTRRRPARRRVARAGVRRRSARAPTNRGAGAGRGRRPPAVGASPSATTRPGRAAAMPRRSPGSSPGQGLRPGTAQGGAVGSGRGGIAAGRDGVVTPALRRRLRSGAIFCSAAQNRSINSLLRKKSLTSVVARCRMISIEGLGEASRTEGERRGNRRPSRAAGGRSRSRQDFALARAALRADSRVGSSRVRGAVGPRARARLSPASSRVTQVRRPPPLAILVSPETLEFPQNAEI